MEQSTPTSVCLEQVSEGKNKLELDQGTMVCLFQRFKISGLDRKP